MGLHITVLGKSPSWQDAGGACSGYLVEEDGARVLLDCGNGVFAKLRSRCEYTEVDAVVISHLHADHFLDLVPFAYGLLYAPRDPTAGARPAIHAPSGAREVFRRVVGAWGSEDLIERAFDLHEYDPADTLRIGPLRVRFSEVPHFLQTCAVEFTGGETPGRFTFGADTGPAQSLIEFARDTDLLLVEATLTEPEDDGRRGHLTPAEAGEHGRLAGARRLVLTHISDELDADWARREAERTFGGAVEVAVEGAVYEV